jgi:hypothetical protein
MLKKGLRVAVMALVDTAAAIVMCDTLNRHVVSDCNLCDDLIRYIQFAPCLCV